MHALIDSDIICYEFGALLDENMIDPLPWLLIKSRVDARLISIIEAVEADTYQLYLTDSPSNFRLDVATIQPYKGKRPSEKSFWWLDIRNYLIEQWHAEVVYGMEADDKLSIEQWADRTYRLDLGELPYTATVICSRDKDLDMVIGYHYGWEAGAQKEKKLWWQDELGGLKCFYKQLLTGDAVDNIPGLYRVGAKSSACQQVDECTNELSMYEVVRREYTKRFGSHWVMFIEENAILLWMLREPHNVYAASFRMTELEQELWVHKLRNIFSTGI